MTENTSKTSRQNSTSKRTSVITTHIDKCDINKITEDDSLLSPDSDHHLSCIHMTIPGQAALMPQKLTNKLQTIPHSKSPNNRYDVPWPTRDGRERAVFLMTIKTELSVLQPCYTKWMSMMFFSPNWSWPIAARCPYKEGSERDIKKYHSQLVLEPKSRTSAQ
jgi:hypothetical protein